MSLFYNYAVLTLCKISKLSGVRILRYQHYGETNERMDERMDERTDEAEFIGPFRLKSWVKKSTNLLSAKQVQQSNTSSDYLKCYSGIKQLQNTTVPIKIKT